MKQYTPEELTQLHQVLYEILEEIVRICDKHNIPYFVIGGTAIGALYDKAILPWDDDIDIGMKREDYNKFLKIAPHELKKQYFLSWINTDSHTPYYFAKVKKNNTLFTEEMFKDVPMHQGIFVDIFPFDRIPDNKLLRKIQYETVNFLKCCLMGKEAWLWRHFGKCQISNPTNRGAATCLLNRIVDSILPKKTIYRLMVAVQSCFNSWKTRYYNNVITTTDHVLETSLNHLQPIKFGPLCLKAPDRLEDFLRHNYPSLHRYTKEEQDKINNHYPAALSFNIQKDHIATAPVALFVYNRLHNTRQTIEHLKKNKLATHTPLYIFSDGGKNDTSWREVNELRNYLHTVSGFREVHIVERPENFYLERNIIEGIAHVLQHHDTVIVLEDDICTSPVFLEYMNNALNKYADIPQVMHVAGFTNLDIPQQGDTYFTPHMSGWGWATWKDRWQHFVHFTSRQEALQGMTAQDLNKLEYGGNFRCLHSLDKTPIPWDICWEIAIYKQKGLCLCPTHTLIKNIGISSGTHFNSKRVFGWYEYDRPYRTESVTLDNIPIKESAGIETLYAQALKDHGMRYNLLGKMVRRIYLKVKAMKKIPS